MDAGGGWGNDVGDKWGADAGDKWGDVGDCVSGIEAGELIRRRLCSRRRWRWEGGIEGDVDAR